MYKHTHTHTHTHTDTHTDTHTHTHTHTQLKGFHSLFVTLNLLLTVVYRWKSYYDICTLLYNLFTHVHINTSLCTNDHRSLSTNYNSACNPILGHRSLSTNYNSSSNTILGHRSLSTNYNSISRLILRFS